MPTRPIEGDHQLAAEPLAQRVVGDERLELACERAVSAEAELRLHQLLECDDPQFGKPRDLALGERLVADVGERRAAPEAEGLAQRRRGGRRVAGAEQLAPPAEQLLEAPGVDLVLAASSA